jgi:hypothetical protein
MSPDGCTDDHGHGTELERPAPTDPIGNGAAEQAADESSSQADADHQSCTHTETEDFPSQLVRFTKKHPEICSWNGAVVPSASVFPAKPRSVEMLSSGSFTTLKHEMDMNTRLTTGQEYSSWNKQSLTKHERTGEGGSTHPVWYPKRNEVSVATHTCGNDLRHDGPEPPSFSLAAGNEM